MIPGYWGFLKQGGVLQGYPYAKSVWYVGSSAPVFGKRADTLTNALGLMRAGDVLFLGPQAYTEGNLVIPATLENITIIGAGNRGSCFIEPETAADEGLTVLADGVTLFNVGVADGGSGDFGLSVGSADVSPDRFRAYGCKFEGSAIGARLYGAGDVLMDDCEFAWAATGLQLRANLVGFNTEIFIRNCRFHNYATVGVGEFANAQQVDNLNLLDCVFERQEDGTAGTDDILLQHNDNHGIVSGCRFPRATNSSATSTVGTGILWVANATEAGWSTARPA